MTDASSSSPARAESDEELLSIPDPNEAGHLEGEILPDDWTPDGER